VEHTKSAEAAADLMQAFNANQASNTARVESLPD
jgi:hypothetical protein